MTIMVKPPRYDDCGLSISRYTIILTVHNRILALATIWGIYGQTNTQSTIRLEIGNPQQLPSAVEAATIMKSCAAAGSWGFLMLQESY